MVTAPQQGGRKEDKMYYSILVTVGEGETDLDIFCQIVDKHYAGLSDFLDIRLPYVMIERIPYGSHYESLMTNLSSNGCTVWVVTEPKPNGHHEVIYNRKTKRTDGIAKLSKFANLPQTQR